VERRNACKILIGKLQTKKKHFDDVSINERIILKRI
jgi:hypothetical protein